MFFPSPYPCQKEIDAGAPTSPAQVIIVAHSPAALLPSLLPPQSSLSNGNLLSINQIKRFCLLKTCQLPPFASSHRFVQGLTRPACACSMTSSYSFSMLQCLWPWPWNTPSSFHVQGLLPLSHCFSCLCLACSFSELWQLLKCHLRESHLPLLLWLE